MGSFGNLMRSFDAGPYRGRRIRFRAAVKVERTGGDGAGEDAASPRAQLWVRVDRRGGAIGFFDNMADRPITDASWRPYEIAGDVAVDAVSLHLGVMLFGGGRAWLGAARLDAIGKMVSADEPARPLEARGSENLIAFARLAGVVRYFHPSDQAAGTDWNYFVLAGVESVEKAAGPQDLAARLRTLFQPIAPALRIFLTGQAEPAAAGPLAPPLARRVLAWRHLGLGLGMEPSGGLYSSERIDTAKAEVSQAEFNRAQLTGAQLTGAQLNGAKLNGAKLNGAKLNGKGEPLRPALPEPGKPLRVDLGGGVSALVPLAVYAGAGGTVPVAPQGVPLAAPAKPKGFEPSGNDRATRLADVILAWNVFEHFYPDFDPHFDVAAADWPGELRRALRSAATDRDERAFLDTLRRLVAALHDGHGNVALMKAGRSFGLPVLWEWVEGQLVITEVDRASGGLVRRGDVVTAIDGRRAREAIAAEEELISAATPQWRRFRALAALRVGLPVSVRLDLERPAGGKATVTLRRSLPAYGPGALAERRPAKIAEVAPGVWYFDTGRAGDEDWQGALDRLERARGIVFDFRGYPRTSPMILQHLTSTPLRSAQWRVPVIVRPDRVGMIFQSSAWNLPPLAPRLTARIAFVTDGRAISYAESCLGIVEHYHLGEIVGGPTAGTNGNINSFRLPGGYRIVWTGMQVEKQDGSRHDGVGIRPTIPVAPTLAGIRAGRDEVLAKAIARVAG